MAGASVTIESLNNVKKAFSDFQTDVESLSEKISSSTERILIEVKQSLKKQENLVVVLENKVSSLINDIEQIQTSIIGLRYDTVRRILDRLHSFPIARDPEKMCQEVRKGFQRIRIYIKSDWTEDVKEAKRLFDRIR